MTIASYWPVWFRALLGGGLPKSYCCIDLETTGFSHDRDVIVEWGHALIIDGAVTDRLSLVIDWTDHDIVPMHWLVPRLAAVEQSMRQSGKTYQHSIERMRKEGIKPAKALTFIRDFTAALQQKHIPFVAHNAAFEERMLCASFMGFGIAGGFTFGDNGFIDTDCLEKAIQAVDNPRMHPRQGDTLRDYFHRVKYARLTGIKSNLDDHCFRKYGFDVNHGITRDKLHGAYMDAYCTHLVLAENRKAETAVPLPVPIFPDADHKAMRKTGAPVRTVAPVVGVQRWRGQRSN